LFPRRSIRRRRAGKRQLQLKKPSYLVNDEDEAFENAVAERRKSFAPRSNEGRLTADKKERRSARRQEEEAEEEEVKDPRRERGDVSLNVKHGC